MDCVPGLSVALVEKPAKQLGRGSGIRQRSMSADVLDTDNLAAGVKGERSVWKEPSRKVPRAQTNVRKVGDCQPCSTALSDKMSRVELQDVRDDDTAREKIEQRWSHLAKRRRPLEHCSVDAVDSHGSRFDVAGRRNERAPLADQLS